MNVVCLVGRFTATPELRQTTNGINVSSFSIAVQSSNKNADGSYKTDFVNCVAWRNNAEFITKYFKKGQMVGINGSIQTRIYQDKDTGKNRTAFEILVSNTYFVESKKNVSSDETTKEGLPPVNSFQVGSLDDFANIASDDNDLPF